MKSYNVKSNAKRAARQLSAKFPSYTPAEPIAVSQGAREWFPALIAPTKVIAEGVPEEIRNAAMVNGQTAEAAAARIEGHEVIRGGAKSAPKIEQPAADVHVIPADTPLVLSKKTMDELAARLPPPVKSTPDEIAERRQARRERIEKEKTEGKPEKQARATKSDALLKIVSREGGALLWEIAGALGWQPHTIRGYIAGTLRKRGHNIVSTRTPEGARYTLVKTEAADA